MNKNIILRTIAIVFFSIFVTSLNAQLISTGSAVFYGSTTWGVNKTINTAVQGGVASADAAGKILYQNKSLVSGVKLALNTTTIPSTITTAFTAKVSVLFEYYLDNDPTNLLTDTKTVEVNYDPGAGAKYKNIDVAFVRNAYKLTAKLLPSALSISVAGVPLTTISTDYKNFITIQAFTEQERFENLDNIFGTSPWPSPYNTPAVNAVYLGSGNNELILSWSTTGAHCQGYELEYTFIDDYNNTLVSFVPPANLNFTFRNNSTRILVTKPPYRLQLLQEHGYLVYRIRPFTMAGNGFEQIVYGNYGAGTGGNGVFNVFSFPNKYAVAGTEVHSGDKLNWQSVTTFAEESKSKTVIKYMDGTMRNRQTVTATSTERQAIVAETIYDYQGRPAVNVLPVPQTSPAIHYFNNCNQNLAGTPYKYADFDTKGVNPCYPYIINPMKQTANAGAANYYSLQNGNKGGFNAFIPDANGYPFTRVNYMPDQTDRVVRQGGVGEIFQPGKTAILSYQNHDTKFYYGKPEQTILDMLFGTNVGYAEFYQKNLVLDANGQASVSYVDLDGKTIATALAGEAPVGMDQLDSYQIIPISDDLLSGSDNINSIDHSITNAQSFLVSKDNTPYSFSYQINPQTFSALSCAGKSYCLDCIYDLEITLVKDECAKVEFAKTKTIGKLSSLDFVCHNDPATLFHFDTLVNLNIGSYTITKKLVVNKQAAETYANNVINDPANSCLKSFNDFYNEAWAKRDTNRCKEACDACKAQANVLSGSAASGALNECDSMWCHPKIGNMCDISRASMISDLSPGGQYAIYKNDVNDLDLHASLISIFNNVSISGIKNLFYPGSPGIAGISVQIPGNPLFPLSHYLSPDDSLYKLIDNWPDDLSEKLLPLHPEYCYLQFCNENRVDLSNDFETKYMDALTKADATTAGLLIDIDHFYLQDPFYQMLGVGVSPHAYGTLQGEFVAQFNNFSGTGYSIKDIAVYTANCPSGGTIASCAGVWGDGISDDEEWDRFKLLYYNLKQEYFQKAREQYVINKGCCSNDYIGCDPDKNNCSVHIWPLWATPTNPCKSIFNLILYQKAKKRFSTINDIEFPGMPNLTNSIYNMSATDLQNAVNNSSATSPCPSCPEMDAFKAMIIASQEKKFIFNNRTVTADAIGGLKDSLRLRFLGSLTSSNVTFNHTSSTQFTISNPNCTLTFTADTAIAWETAQIIPSCLGITDYKHATLNVIVNGSYKTKISITSTCDIFYCSGQAPAKDTVKNNCKCTENYNNSTKYQVGAVVSYQNKCYLLSKGDNINTLSPGSVPTNTKFWTSLCDQTSACVDALLMDFDNGETFTTGLTMSPSVGLNQYKVSNTFSNSLTNKIYPSNVFLAYPTMSNTNVLSKTVAVQSYKKYLISFDISMAYNSPAPTSILSLEVLLNGTSYATYPMFGNAWATYTVPFSSATATSLNIQFKLLSNGKDVLAIDNIKVACLGDDFSGASRLALNTSPAHGNSPQRYIPQNNCDCSACNMDLPSPPLPYIPCDSILKDLATQQANIAYAAYRDSVFGALLGGYYAKCMQSLETFTKDYNLPEYHFTLYYYDQSGNLVRTIPPAGVKTLPPTSIAGVRTARDANSTTLVVPNHIMPTTYRHNSLNAVVWQSTPDAGEANFYYDKLGRIVLSQNAEQKITDDASYTYYDPLGRNVEAGKINGCAVLSTIVSNYIAWPSAINVRSRKEITRSYYDRTADPFIAAAFGAATLPNYLRNRISTSAVYENEIKMAGIDYMQASHYRYDIAGNVIDLLQDYGKDAPFGNANIRTQSKRIQYAFDLISGKVNALYYEIGKPDQFIYKYKYNADNKLTDAYSSKNGLIWEHDAHYIYYRHGPLARTEIGTDSVQGIDYAYNLQGWIKGINGYSKDFNTDAGQDGSTLPTPGLTASCIGCPGPVSYKAEHNKFANDAASYWLSYYKDDYKPIGNGETTVDNSTAPLVSGTYNTAPNDLFNGNIRSMYTNLQPFGGMGMKYKYDQLNRIKNQDAYDFATGAGIPALNNAYKMALTYDANGNIKSLLRNGTSAIPGMDNLKYTYYNYDASTGATTTYPTGTNPSAIFDCNRLASVQDNTIYTGNYPNTSNPEKDIDNQGTINYTYDKIGNLITDPSEGISSIKWNLQNKIIAITKTVASITTNIKYEYDPTGKRIMKKVITSTGATKEDYYVLDPQGNTLAVYNKDSTGLHWQEQHLYGSARLGIMKQDVMIPTPMLSPGGTGSTTGVGGSLTTPIFIGGIDMVASSASTTISGTLFMAGTIEFTNTQRNTIQYEIPNHLGNVLATVSDAKKLRMMQILRVLQIIMHLGCQCRGEL
ncbi:MAG: RHS repeat protein [Chitinophagaceae bacterium]|nr:RHS repeat protein [Chitinophagaceae bacterium]